GNDLHARLLALVLSAEPHVLAVLPVPVAGHEDLPALVRLVLGTRGGRRHVERRLGRQRSPVALDPHVSTGLELPAAIEPHVAGALTLEVTRDPFPVATAPVPATLHP